MKRSMLTAGGMSQGFTLLEVLIAMSIVSILAMIAIPYYQDYRTRTKVAGEFGLVEPVKKRVTEEFLVKGVWPSDNSAALVNAPADYHGQYLQSVEVVDVPTAGALKLTYDNTKLPALGANNVIVFYPQPGDGAVSWRCDEGNMVDNFRPHTCR